MLTDKLGVEMANPEMPRNAQEEPSVIGDLAVYLQSAIDRAMQPYLQMAERASSEIPTEVDYLKTRAQEVGREAGLSYIAAVRNGLDLLEAGLTRDGLFPYAETWNQMTPEQQMLTGKLSKEIAKNFEQHGVTVETLHLIKVETESGESQFVLIHTGAGIDIGDHTKDSDPARSYNAVMSPQNDKLFIIEVDGERYETRRGMTEATYDALQRYLQDSNLPIPDSEQFSKDTGDVRTYTILTGEPLTAPGNVLVRDGIDRSTFRQTAQCHSGTRDLRVRPAVVIS
jgi:hypothetical protein